MQGVQQGKSEKNEKQKSHSETSASKPQTPYRAPPLRARVPGSRPPRVGVQASTGRQASALLDSSSAHSLTSLMTDSSPLILAGLVFCMHWATLRLSITRVLLQLSGAINGASLICDNYLRSCNYQRLLVIACHLSNRGNLLGLLRVSPFSRKDDLGSYHEC